MGEREEEEELEEYEKMKEEHVMNPFSFMQMVELQWKKGLRTFLEFMGITGIKSKESLIKEIDTYEEKEFYKFDEPQEYEKEREKLIEMLKNENIEQTPEELLIDFEHFGLRLNEAEDVVTVLVDKFDCETLKNILNEKMTEVKEGKEKYENTAIFVLREAVKRKNCELKKI